MRLRYSKGAEAMKEELEEETEYEVPIGLQTCMYILATSLVV